jgi:hypothetical protein
VRSSWASRSRLQNAADRLSQCPQCVLQAFRERHEALAAEHDVSMLEARERQSEVIEPMIEPHTGLSVKSDRPIRPGGCSWRKITSRLGP